MVIISQTGILISQIMGTTAANTAVLVKVTTAKAIFTAASLKPTHQIIMNRPRHK